MRKLVVLLSILILPLKPAIADNYICNGESLTIEFDYQDTYCFFIKDYYTGDLIDPGKVDILMSENKKRIVITNNGTRGEFRLFVNNLCDNTWFKMYVTLYEKDENISVALPENYMEGEELVYAGGENITFQVRPEYDRIMNFDYVEGYVGIYKKGCAYYSGECKFLDTDYNIDIKMLGFSSQGNKVKLRFVPSGEHCDEQFIDVYVLQEAATPVGNTSVIAGETHTYNVSNYDPKSKDYSWKIEPSMAGVVVSSSSGQANIRWSASYFGNVSLSAAVNSSTGTGTYSHIPLQIKVKSRPQAISNIWGASKVCYSQNSKMFEYRCDYSVYASDYIWSVSGTGASIQQDTKDKRKAIVTISSSTKSFTVSVKGYNGVEGQTKSKAVTVSQSIDIDFSQVDRCSNQGEIPVRGVLPEGGKAWVDNYKVVTTYDRNNSPVQYCVINETTARLGDDNFLDIGIVPATGQKKEIYLKYPINIPPGNTVRQAILSFETYNEAIVPYLYFGAHHGLPGIGNVQSIWNNGKEDTKYKVDDYNLSGNNRYIELDITHIFNDIKDGIYFECTETSVMPGAFVQSNMELEITHYTKNTINTNLPGSNFNVNYEINSGACIASKNEIVQIIQKPIARFSPSSYCLEALPISLSSGSGNVTGTGFYTGSNISGPSNFDADKSGDYEIQYVFTASNGCQDIAIQNIKVFDPPSFTLNSLDEVCGGTQVSVSIPNPTNYTRILWDVDGQKVPDMGTVSFTSNTSFAGYKNVKVEVTDKNGCSGTIEKAIRINETPVLIMKDRTECKNSFINYYPETATVGDNSPLTYSWGNGTSADHQSFLLQNSQTINLTTTSQKGCSASDYAVITALELPYATVNNDEVCFGDMATLSASPFIPSWDYNWNTGQRGNQIVVTPSSIGRNDYIVWVTDDNGCSNNASGEVLVNPPPYFSLADQIICYGEKTSITVPGSFAQYRWSNGETTPTIVVTGIITTNYSCTVTDINGCTASDEMKLTVLQPSALIMENVDACKGEYATLKAPGGFTYYHWSNGVEYHSTDVYVDQTRNYTLNVLDINGCSNESTFTVFANPVPILEMEDSGINEGETITLTAPLGYAEYVWSTGHMSETIQLSPTETTVYWLKVTTEKGCPATDDFKVIVYDLPEIKIEDQNLCKGETLQLSAPEGYVSYLWTADSKETFEGRVVNVSPRKNTVFNLRITNETGGIGGTTFVVYVHEIPEITCRDTLVCYKNPVVLSTKKGYSTYTWSNGNTDSEITINPEFTSAYSVTVTDADNGCQNTKQITVFIDNPTTDFTASMKNIRPGEPVQFVVSAINQTNSYTWTFGDDTDGGGPNVLHYYYEEGLFDVSLNVLSANQCAATTTKEGFINVSENNTGVSVKENEVEIPGIKLYPVPVRSVLQIDARAYNRAGEIDVSIYNASAQLMDNFKVHPKDVYEYSMSGYPGGPYIVLLRVNNILASQKIIKIE